MTGWRADDRRCGLRRVQQRRHDFARPEDWILGWRHAASQQIGLLIGALASALVIGATLKLFNDTSTIFAKREFAYCGQSCVIHGKISAARRRSPGGCRVYNVVHFTSETAPRSADGKYIVPPGKYLADNSGKIHYLVDPGINGTLEKRDPRPGEVRAKRS